jgi:type IV pilus assembly protein PilA
MYSFRKSKKGFTLIELMVVVAIIGVLALLGLRLYIGQQKKAKEAIVKANSGTAQTLVQAEMADGPISGGLAGAVSVAIAGGMRNPFVTANPTIIPSTTALATGNIGAVVVTVGGGTDDGTWYTFRGITDISGTATLFGDTLNARR